MSSLEEDWEEYKKVEVQLQNQLMAELEKTLEEQAQFSKFLEDWTSAIGKENIQAIYYEGRKLWDYSQV